MSGTPPLPPRSNPRKRPPGPRGSVRSTLLFHSTPLTFLSRMLREHGDIFAVDLLGMPIIVLNHPTFIDHVLKRHHHNYDRGGPAVEMARELFGYGLGTAARPSWLWQRRLLQPAFHRQRIATFGELMTAEVDTTLDRWEQARSEGLPIDIGAEMVNLTLRIVVETLFGLAPSDTMLRRFTNAVSDATEELASFVRFPLIPLSVPTAGHRRFQRATRELDAVTYELIRRHRKGQSDRHSLLSLMMHARDAETGDGMSDSQLRDEVLTMLFAGHETSANTLTWVWYLLGRHPEVERRLRAEIDSVLADRRPTMDDVPKLTYTRQVIEETLRLYSPAWQNYRQALADDEIGGYRIPAGTTIFWSYYFVHRHESYWDNAELFNPDRFSDANSTRGDHPGYFPFGAGPRLCIGNAFAMAEMQLTIAMTLQRYRLVPTTTKVIDPIALLTLQPGRSVDVYLDTTQARLN